MALPLARDHLDHLESEAIHIIRETAATFKNPAILYSVGKDSSVVLHLARKAFYPGKIPFPLLHVDTGFDFPEMYEFRDWFVKEIGGELLVYRNEEALSENTNPYALGTQRCCELLRTKALVAALQHHKIDGALGGARREEEKSRAKERVFSVRDKHGQWDPRDQRPELWSLYNPHLDPGSCMRVFPISNWTELDVWHYIHREEIPVVPLYFAEEREVVIRRDGIYPIREADKTKESALHERKDKMMVRYRTLGCTPCSGAIPSNATTVPEIIEEMIKTKVSERATRLIDHDTDGSMEIKKRQGYF